MEINGMMEMAKRQSYWWWFDSHNNNPRRSQWLQSTLAELDERTKSILMIIDQEADSFAQRAEMYYKKRPQLISLIEDFYRTHRSLAMQFDHLRQDPATRRTSSLVRSFSLSTDEPEKAILGPRKSYDGCFTKLAYDSDSDSIGSEVDDPIPMPEVNYDLMTEIDRLKEDAMIQKRKLAEKETAMEEMKRKLDEACNEVMELKEETEKLRLENAKLYHLKVKEAEEKERLRMNLMEEKDQLIDENVRQKQMLEEKDDGKREVIRQLSLAIEMLKSENLVIKKLFANDRVKKWNPFEFQGLKGFRKLFKC